MKEINILKAVKENVFFQYYREGNLWYATQDGNLFPVQIDDIGTATFNSQDKGILFMRYMRKWNKTLMEKPND